MENTDLQKNFIEALREEEAELKRFAKKRFGKHTPSRDEIVLDTSFLDRPVTRGKKNEKQNNQGNA